MTTRTLRISTAITFAALIALMGYVLAQAFPSTEAVRLRNSLLITLADARAGDWSPENTPSTFLAETAEVPSTIATAARGAISRATGSDLDKARALVGHLLTHVKDKGPIQNPDIEKTYRAIVDRGEGYCADVIDTFIALALSTGLAVRPWAFSFDGYGGHGHIVVEVFDRDRRQWIMLDVYDNVMPVLAATGNPLAVRDFVPLFRGHEDAVKFIPIGAGRVAYSSAGKLREYYREGINEWYLWNGNNVVSRGRSSLLARLLGDAFEPLGELAAIALGEFPRIVPLPSPTSPAQVERMIALRARLLAIAGTCAVLVALLVVQLFALYRRRHRRHAPISDHP